MNSEQREHARPASVRGAVGPSLRERARDTVRFHPRETVALGVLALLVVCGAGIAYLRARPAPAAALAPVSSPQASASPEGAIVVQVDGAVRKPGVYTLAQGARVFQAVRAAGGFAPDAERYAIN